MDFLPIFAVLFAYGMGMYIWGFYNGHKASAPPQEASCD